MDDRLPLNSPYAEMRFGQNIMDEIRINIPINTYAIGE